MPLRGPGDPFPSLTLARTGGGTLTLPDEVSGSFGVVLFYRGSWCPYCTAQLRQFQHLAEPLTQLDTRVVALSVDDEATTQRFVDRHRLKFPMGHSADPAVVSGATGAFLNPDPPYLQATGFVLDRDGAVIVSVYSSGAIGRLTADDTVRLIRYRREQVG